MAIERLDLRKRARDAKKLYTTIDVTNDWGQKSEEWLVLGPIELNKCERGNKWRLKAYACGPRNQHLTDFEHSSAQLVSFEVIGLTLDMVINGRLILDAWIETDPQGDGFHVPPAGFDPAKGAEVCKHCKDEPHLLGEFYVPKHNAKLYEQLRGRRIRIAMGPHYKNDDGEE